MTSDLAISFDLTSLPDVTVYSDVTKTTYVGSSAGLAIPLRSCLLLASDSVIVQCLLRVSLIASDLT